VADLFLCCVFKRRSDGEYKKIKINTGHDIFFLTQQAFRKFRTNIGGVSVISHRDTNRGLKPFTISDCFYTSSLRTASYSSEGCGCETGCTTTINLYPDHFRAALGKTS